MSYRLKVEERDLSGFVVPISNQVGAMVVKSRKGNKTPTLCQNESEVVRLLGNPNSDNFGVFEAIEYAFAGNPIWVTCALGTGYRYAGVDVKTTSVETFGSRTGRVYDTFSDNSYSTTLKNLTYTDLIKGNGITNNFNGTINTSGVAFPIIGTSVQLKVGSNTYAVTINTGTNAITSSVLTGVNTFNVADGSYNITFSGASGTLSSYTSNVDVSSGVNLDPELDAQNKGIDLTIDGVLYKNISFGNSSTTTRASIISAINTAVGQTVAYVSGNFIQIRGLYADTTLGQVKIAPASNLGSAVRLVFDSTATNDSVLSGSTAISPTGFIPQAKDSIVWDFNFNKDIKSETCFSIFTTSPFDDLVEKYSVTVNKVANADKQYRIILYLDSSTGGSSIVGDYTFSLDKQKLNGKSIYYEDIFDNDPYITIYVNSSYAGVCNPVSTTPVYLTGGNRGSEPLASDYVEAWNRFRKRNLYPIKTFMDVYGTSASTLANLIEQYHPYAFGITCVPYGYNVDAAVQFRTDLGLDFDGLALYTNWIKISDTYNNTFAWTSGVGKMGVKYGQMGDFFDGLAPAGTDENGIGGQINGLRFTIIELERDYTDFELQVLDEAQINPIIKDSVMVMAYGDKTLQVATTDTSFIPHRRLLNYITDNISTKILKQQIFKLNDSFHRLVAKTQSDILIAPIFNINLLRDFLVVCDESNNTDAVLAQRKFILDVYVKVTPFSEFVQLRITRLPQNAIIAEYIGG
jgi:hypothetical protein